MMSHLIIFIMGKFNQGILGGFSGKVGTVIGVTWKGITFMRGIAPHHSDAQSQRQLDQRLKFSVVMKFLLPLSGFIRIGFKDYAIRMTALNAAFSYNLRNALQGTYPAYTINYANALVARGNLAPALNPVASSTIAGTILFNWDNNSDEMNANPTDLTLIVVYNPSKNQAVFQQNTSERADETQSVTVPISFTGDQVQCYIAFASMDGQVLSNSTYAGAVTVA
jgi:hypothetical protein